MAGEIEKRLKEKGIELPEAASPAANYVPWVVSGKTVYIAGQVPFNNGELEYIGKLGDAYGVEEGQAAARLVALNIIAQVKAACGGDLDKVAQCAKLGCFVNSTPDFTEQPKVANGASDLMVEVFGDAGKHARFALSAGSLPFNVAVEIDAVFTLK